MGFVTVRCAGCGVRVRMTRPESALGRGCPACGFALETSLACTSAPQMTDEAPPELAEDSRERPARGWGRAPLFLLTLVALVALGSRFGAWPGGAGHSKSIAIRPRPVPTRACPAERPAPAVIEADASCRAVGPRVADRAADPDEEATTSSVPVDGFDGAIAATPSPSPSPPPTLQASGAERRAAPPLAPAPETELAREAAPRRIRVQTETGQVVVARVHGTLDDQISVILPDGQLGLPRALVYTDEPFRPSQAEEMKADLLAGPFAQFHVRQSAHYLVFYQSTASFADASARLLEELYQGLTEAFRKRDIPVHEPEFPLVAVIFRTERDFRAHKKVDRDVQAYYEIFTNRIYLYQTSERDEKAPEVSALRKPQTVAHEGTHQILQNIGVQPRLSAWPIWLIEGLAEYCAAGVTTRKGVAWRGLGVINPLHMATIRDLGDPLSIQVMGPNRPRIGRDPRMPLVEYLVTRTELTPTDYALAWALTHYLALKRGNEFVAYLRTMSQIPPMKRIAPEEHLAAFRSAFGPDLSRMDRAVATYLAKLKNYDQLPYYAVMFEQRVGGGMIRRAAIVSQSPSMIRQWLETISTTDGVPPAWEALPHPTRARALLTAEQWMRSH